LDAYAPDDPAIKLRFASRVGRSATTCGGDEERAIFVVCISWCCNELLRTVTFGVARRTREVGALRPETSHDVQWRSNLLQRQWRRGVDTTRVRPLHERIVRVEQRVCKDGGCGVLAGFIDLADGAGAYEDE
jgi:hypothetical protein